jgi:tetratricopeptide (TPR) repeat protein
LADQNLYPDIVAALDERRDEPPQVSTLILAAKLLSWPADRGYDREARTLYERALTLKPKQIEGQLGLARVAARMGDLDAAVAAYRQVLEQDPYHLAALKGLGRMLGEDLGRPAAGLEYIEKAIRFEPDDPHVLDTRGVLLLRLGRLDEARQALERCVQRAHDAPKIRARALLHLAQTYEQQGESAPARARRAEAQELDRKHKLFTDQERAELAQLSATP